MLGLVTDSLLRAARRKAATLVSALIVTALICARGAGQESEHSDAWWRRTLEESEADPDCRTAVGKAHAPDYPLESVRDPKTGEYLAPYYAGIEQEIIDHRDRLQQYGDSHFWPYPQVPFTTPRNHRVAIIDSGVLLEHPLLQGHIVLAADVTGQGVADRCGHGTIEALRQVVVEPHCELIIVNAFGAEGKPSPLNLIKALDFLRDKDVGFVFLAGGIGRKANPSGAAAVRRAATRFVEDTGALFVATRGNDPEETFSPADADGVLGMAVFDSESLKPSPLGNASGGFGVRQKGHYTSYPDLEALSLGQYYSRISANLYLRRETDLALDYGERAVRAAPKMELALRLAAVTNCVAGNLDRCAELLEMRREFYPESAAEIDSEQAHLLAISGKCDEAETLFQRTLGVLPNDATTHRAYSLLLRRTDRPEKAVEHLGRAAHLHPMFVDELHAFGRELYYSKQFVQCIAANEAVLAADPSYCLAHYNIAACHCLLGNLAEAHKRLGVYEASLDGLDGSNREFEVESVRRVFAAKGFTALMTGLEYGYGTNRAFCQHYGRLRELEQRGVDALRRALPELSDSDLSDLLISAVDIARHDGLNGRDSQLARLLPLLTALAENSAARGARNAATAWAWQALGGIHHRFGNCARAIACYDSAIDIWRDRSIRRKETALAEKGFSLLRSGDLEGADKAFAEGESTSFWLKQVEVEGRRGVASATFEPRLKCGRALVARLRGEPPSAVLEPLEAAYAADQQHLETLILIFQQKTLSSATAEEKKSGYLALRTVLEFAANDIVLHKRLERLLEEHPIYDDIPETKESMQDIMDRTRGLLRSGEITLNPRTKENLAKLSSKEFKAFLASCAPCAKPPANPDALPITAIVGTGIRKHPFLKGRLVDALDLTGEGIEDRNGSSTFQALATIAHAEGNARLLVVKVLGQNGKGSAQNLKYGVLWALEHGARIINLNVLSKVHDPHLVGVTSMVAREAVIIMTAADEPSEAPYPYDPELLGKIVLVR